MTAMRKKIECCNGCKKRASGCHSTCEDYIREKEELNELHTAIQAEKDAAEQVREYHKNNWKRRNPKKPIPDGGKK